MKDRDRSAQDRAYDYLKRGITNLEFTTNRKLRTQDLAAALEMSRTPVREALSRLEQEGLVRRADGWGYSVVAVEPADAMKLFGVREALEVQAVREAILRLRDSTIKALGRSMKRAGELLDRGRITEFRAINRKFHALIVAEADNELLRQMLSIIEDRIRLVGGLVIAKHGGRGQEVLRDNMRIYDALRKRDMAAAVRAVRGHIRRARRDFIRYVQKGGYDA